MGLIADIKKGIKLKKALKEAKKIIDENQGVAKDVKNVIKNLKADIEVLLGLLPCLKDVYFDLLDLFKDVK